MTPAALPGSKSPSRRSVLAGALGAVVGLAATAIGRASPVEAANGDTVKVSGAFTGSGTTEITTTGAANAAIWGNATATGGTAVGVRGDTSSPSPGAGVWGTSSSG